MKPTRSERDEIQGQRQQSRAREESEWQRRGLSAGGPGESRASWFNEAREPRVALVAVAASSVERRCTDSGALRVASRMSDAAGSHRYGRCLSNQQGPFTFTILGYRNRRSLQFIRNTQCIQLVILGVSSTALGKTRDNICIPHPTRLACSKRNLSFPLVPKTHLYLSLPQPLCRYNRVFS